VSFKLESRQERRGSAGCVAPNETEPTRMGIVVPNSEFAAQRRAARRTFHTQIARCRRDGHDGNIGRNASGLAFASSSDAPGRVLGLEEPKDSSTGVPGPVPLQLRDKAAPESATYCRAKRSSAIRPAAHSDSRPASSPSTAFTRPGRDRFRTDHSFPETRSSSQTAGRRSLIPDKSPEFGESAATRMDWSG
jgi:hypothetical protein